MHGWLIVILICLGLALLLFFMPIRVFFHYKRNAQDDRLVIITKTFYGLLEYRLQVPGLKAESEFILFLSKSVAIRFGKINFRKTGHNESERSTNKLSYARIIDSIQKFHKKFKKYYQFYRKISRAIRCEKLDWKTEIGLADPAQTGLSVGVVWGMKGIIMSILQQNFCRHWQRPQIYVKPNFEHEVFRTDFDGIFALRIGDIIIAGISFIFDVLLSKVQRGERNE